MKNRSPKFDISIRAFLFSYLFLLSTCSKSDEALYGPLVDLGLSPEEVEIRLTTSLVGELPDGPGNPEDLCANGEMQLMSDDPYCGYVDVGEYCVNQINMYRAMHGLPPYVRAVEYELCAAREARLALENGTFHWNDGCGWVSQGAAGGGRGGDDSDGTVEKSVWWVPKLFYEEGPNGGHYQAMMQENSRFVTCGYYAIDRDSHGIIINYYNEL
ncbi:CAP domain-containing protein [Winogradskyella sp. 3972H.M.0a.05]|uniref:CAP domain-containing protein n=1 Tax=Winogradskyella sp. 3972H.M.0a.05 TaxID=2950277 RepID=UPI003394FC2D